MKSKLKKIAMFIVSVFTFSVLVSPTQQAMAINENQGIIATNIK